MKNLHPSIPVNPKDGKPAFQRVAKARREAERSAILAALKTTNWNQRQAAFILKTDYKGLLYKTKLLDIKKEKPVPPPNPRAAAANSVSSFVAKSRPLISKPSIRLLSSANPERALAASCAARYRG